MNHPLKLFITYSHKNKEQKEELKDRLAVLEQENKITIWHDNEIIPGDKWRDKISDNLADSNILLYLVSAYSLASENCNKELIEALQTKNIRTIPIILEDCDWKKHQLSEFQALPTDGRPINEWEKESKAWQNVVEGIRKTVEKTLSQMQPTPTQNTQEELQALVAFQNGNFFMMLGQMKSAINTYSQAININPKFAEAYSNRGSAKADLGLHKEAIKDFDKAININPIFAEAYGNRGITKVELGQYEKAIKDFDKAININPIFAEAYGNRGVTKAELGQYEEAIKDFNKAININPNDTNAYYNRGLAKAKFEQYEEATEDYDKVININPNNASAYYNRGNVKAELGQYKEAIKDFDKAININPNNASAYYNRGGVKTILGQYEGTIKDYDEVIKFNPNDTKTYINRGIAYLCLNKLENAKADFTTAKNKGTDIVGVFQNEFKSVSDFEKKYNVKLPDNIKALFE